MALNPFFLQGTASEQRLVQDLINEHLQFHGVEVTYIPRKFVNKKTIIEEVQTSKFDDNFAIEAYVNTFEGYGGAGDIMTKFGVSIRDELILTISKERFEDFVAPFMAGQDDGTDNSIIPTSGRPREGDLVYFPLGQRLFEVKFVEHEDPFYQLGKNYVFQLKCELFEYEDEVIDTSIGSIDTQVQDEGHITTLNLIGVGRTAVADAFIQGTVNSGYVSEIFLNNDGYGYTSTPIIGITSSPTGQVGDNAAAVGFITTRGGVTSVEKILLTNAGAGYVVPPTITISGGGGVGASATCGIVTTGQGVIRINITDGGVGYSTAPVITIGSPPNSGIAKTAVGIASIGRVGNNEDVLGNDVLKAILIQDPGRGYSSAPEVIISDPDIIKASGNYIFNELVYGERSLIEARVKSWDADEAILRVAQIGIGATTGNTFFPGETIIGRESGARYPVQEYSEDNVVDKYSENDIFESEADKIIDFSERNPFGTY
jgi:hypothetical protein